MMSTRPSSRNLTVAAAVVYGFVLFHLAAGRITYGFSGHSIKVGENPENLLFLLLGVRLLAGLGKAEAVRRGIRVFSAGLVLLFGGLLVSHAWNPSFEVTEEVGRFIGRVLVGFLLAEWIWLEREKQDSVWRTPFLLGMGWLFFRTPWSHLGNPDLEGPFPHRNLETAFLILSWPVLFLPTGSDDRRRWIFPSAVLVWGLSLVFIILSKSRAGLMGLIVAAAFVGGVHLRGIGSRRGRMGFSVALVVSAVFLTTIFFPRFREFRQELGDPYHRSRAGIWAAAVEGWWNPKNWLVGTGMGDSFDRVLVENPTGNLNYRYRRAHYPHSLYLQWVYWGGIASLAGWFCLGGSLASIYRSSRKSSTPLPFFVACLFGFGVLETFESALRDPRVATLFFLNLGLVGGQIVGPEKNSRRGIARLREKTFPRNHLLELGKVGVLFLPIFWFTLFTFPQILAVGLTVLGTALFVRMRSPFPTAAFFSLLVLQLYLPLLNHSEMSGGQILLVGIVFFLFSGWLSHFRIPGEEDEPGEVKVLYRLAPFVPNLLGGVILLAFLFSKVDLPATFFPWEGWLTALALALLWLSISCWVPFSREQWRRTFSASTVVVTVLFLTGLVRLCLAELRLHQLSADSPFAQAQELGSNSDVLESWRSLLRSIESLGFPLYEKRVRGFALEVFGKRSSEDWIHTAKDFSENLTDDAEGTDPFLKLMARGGRPFAPKGFSIEQESAVGLCVEWKEKQLFVLTDKGRLVTVTAHRGTREHRIQPRTTRFVHCRIDPDGNLFLLESSGNLLRVNDMGALHDGNEIETLEVYPPILEVSGTVRRLAFDPRNGVPWVMDLYGNLWYGTEEGRWVKDTRYVSVCTRDGIDVDVARDFTIAEDGRMALLLCDGEIWTSSITVSGIVGPIRKEHYFPDFAVAQSLSFEDRRYTIVDRYGGIYLEPYPEGEELARLRGTYRFPRSLPVREKRVVNGAWVVDHAFLPEQRWIYLLTRDGVILTNHEWSGIWAY